MADKNEWVGRHNDLPPNYERISETEFWQRFAGGELWVDMTSKWLCNLKAGHPLKHKHLRLFLYHDQTAIGYVERIEAARAAKPKVFFRAYACAHEFKSRTVGRCLTEYTCTKCPYGYTVDSSG